VVLRGPIVAPDAPAELVRLVFDEMLAMSDACKVLYLVVHPPRDGEWMSHELRQRRLRPSLYQIEYTATARIDLRLEPEELLSRMKRSTRRYLRSTHSPSVSLRRGNADDLPIFKHLKDAHSKRLGYAPRPGSYYDVLWESLERRGHVALFIAEHEGRPISALLAVPFGDTSYHMEGPWSGEHAEMRPNEMLEWFAFKWAKSEGYNYVDLMSDWVMRPICLHVP